LENHGVIIGFCAGNAILTYVVNGNTVPIITIREILIASLGLLAIPKEVGIDITEIINNTKCLPTTAGVIEEKKQTANKLNSVSETILQMARSYDSSAQNTLDEQIDDESKKTFKEEVLNSLEDTEEGKPINAKVDTSKLAGLDLKEDNALSMTATDIKKELDSEDFNSTDTSSWEGLL